MRREPVDAIVLIERSDASIFSQGSSGFIQARV